MRNMTDSFWNILYNKVMGYFSHSMFIALQNRKKKGISRNLKVLSVVIHNKVKELCFL
jgi:hypothetical protein